MRQLLLKQTAHDKLPKAPSITPTFRTAYLEVVTLGVRDLKPQGFQVILRVVSRPRQGMQRPNSAPKADNRATASVSGGGGRGGCRKVYQ